MTGVRVLLIAHGHPELTMGGGEMAAYAHFAELRSRGIEAVLLARTDETLGRPQVVFSARSADSRELLFHSPAVDCFRHSQPQRWKVHQDFRGLLERFRPTVVHLHHYVHMGLELIREVRNYDPTIPIVLTLHEFLLICYAEGQMVKTSGLRCQRAASLDCHNCFPNISPDDFFLREIFIKSFLRLVDRFICPSRFLRDRHVTWGLPADRMVVIENGQPATLARTPPDPSLATRFVMLGQISRLKGALVFLEAVRLLPKKLLRTLRFEIHGSLQHQNEAFRAEFAAALRGVSDSVRFCGPYQPQDVGKILKRAGWLVVPSIWWENSPLVIQEAFSSGRPVITGDIGGMAEKVEHGVSGLHFRSGSPSDLAARIEEAATTPLLWDHLCVGVPDPPRIDCTVDDMLALYETVRAERVDSLVPAA